MSDLTLKDGVEGLKALAEKATPGPWFHRQANQSGNRGESCDWIADDPRPGRHKKIIVPRGVLFGGSDDYAFIAAASPQAILSLLQSLQDAEARASQAERDRNEALREVHKWAREAGEAKGRLEMSEAAGIVDGWRERAEAAEARASRWQPIETAPKDGMVLVAGQWSDDGSWWRNIGHAHCGVITGEWDDLTEPTHWMPLPEPPALRSPASDRLDDDAPSS